MKACASFLLFIINDRERQGAFQYKEREEKNEKKELYG